MGLQVGHVTGARQRVFIQQEAVPAAGVLPTYVRALATGAVRVIESDIEPKFDRVPRRDAHGGRQDITRHAGKRYASWRLRKYLMGSGAAATPSDDEDIHESFFGTKTVAANVTYSLSSAQQLRTFSLTRIANYDDAIYMSALIGCLCDEWKLMISGSDFPMLEFSGPAYDFRETGYGVNTTVGSNVNKTLGSGEGDGFEGGNPFGSIVQVGADNNGGIGWRVDSVAGDVLTLQGAQVGANGDIVRPYAPTPTTAGVPISHTLGSMIVDPAGAVAAQTFAVKSAEISLKNNAQLFLDHFGETTPVDMKLGIRELMIKMTIRARRDFIVWMGRRKLFQANNIALTCGNTAGARGIFTAPTAEFNVGKMTLPGAGDHAEGEIELEAVMLDTATGQDGNNDACNFVTN